MDIVGSMAVLRQGTQHFMKPPSEIFTTHHSKFKIV